MKTYFGFGIAPSMFPATCGINRRPLSVDEVKVAIADGVTSCLNPSHKETIKIMENRFGIKAEIPLKAPSVLLQSGDRLVVMGVTGLPRLEGRHEYTTGEVEGAVFTFSEFCVQ